MYAIETAKMSSKGQLVIPEAFRKRYGWRAGEGNVTAGISILPVVRQRVAPATGNSSIMSALLC